MLAFAASGAATACAVAIEHALSVGWVGVSVPVRIGIHNGNAKAESGDFFGRTVVVAARIAGAAAGELLVSQAVQESLAGAFALGAPRSLLLKGFIGEHNAFPVIWD
jgi:adenylate cyclase